MNSAFVTFPGASADSVVHCVPDTASLPEVAELHGFFWEMNPGAADTRALVADKTAVFDPGLPFFRTALLTSVADIVVAAPFSAANADTPAARDTDPAFEVSSRSLADRAGADNCARPSSSVYPNTCRSAICSSFAGHGEQVSVHNPIGAHTNCDACNSLSSPGPRHNKIAAHL